LILIDAIAKKNAFSIKAHQQTNQELFSVKAHQQTNQELLTIPHYHMVK